MSKFFKTCNLQFGWPVEQRPQRPQIPYAWYHEGKWHSKKRQEKPNRNDKYPNKEAKDERKDTCNVYTTFGNMFHKIYCKLKRTETVSYKKIRLVFRYVQDNFEKYLDTDTF